MLFHIIFLIGLNYCWASPWNLIGRNQENQFIQEIILRNEEEMKHAPRMDLSHDLPVVTFFKIQIFLIKKLNFWVVLLNDCIVQNM